METTTPAMFELGPRQIAWLEGLESGDYEQAKSLLHDSNGGHCCLGVADIVCDLNERMPGALVNTYKELGLRDDNGSFTGPSVEVGTGKTMPVDSLTELNDHDWTFPQIAAFIRSRASDVFKESK